jgi:NAD(P)-dependent dehydrogenase (short-subunit alcohol dehydrogenase family)
MGRRGRDTGAANHAVDTTIGRRSGRPDELARIVGFLTSTDAGYITGVDLRVDGGAVAALRHDPVWTDVFMRWDGVLRAPEPR